jgi:hypothetical protein
MVSLRRVCKIHEGGVRKILIVALLGAFLEAGVAIGLSSAGSLFLVHVGAEPSPWSMFSFR